MRSLGLVLLILSASTLVSGCGNLSCAFTGDNVRGHLVFSSGQSIERGGSLVVEYDVATDAFATPTRAFITNTQGFAAVPYSVCLNPGTIYNVRAFQDSNGNGTWQSGELAGRDDGDSSANGAYKSRTVSSTSSSSSSENVLTGVDIYLDTTGSQ